MKLRWWEWRFVIIFYLKLMFSPRKVLFLPYLVQRLKDLRDHEKGLALDHALGKAHDSDCTAQTHINWVAEYDDILGSFK